jgi:hypothetical protein
VIEALDPAWGLLVATSDEIDDPSMPLAEPGNFLDVRREDLEPWVRAGSTDVAVVWSSVTRTRDSLEGQLHESSIRSGAQLMRVVDCRLTVTGHDACFDPLPEDAVILLGN